MRYHKKVAMLIETSQERGRGLIRGIIRYSRLFGPWEFFIKPNDLIQTLPDASTWRADGIIARVSTRKLANDLIQSGLPVILLSHRQDQPFDPEEMQYYPNICMANERFGEMAAEHFLSRGFTQFAFFGVPGTPQWSEERRKGFVRVLQNNNITADHIFFWLNNRQKKEATASVIAWLRSLPKPCALLVSYDFLAAEILKLCAQGGIAVPEELAVLGIDNDDLLCESTSPPLSSISCATEQAGFQAAALLDQMMSIPNDHSQGTKTIPIEPIMVVERQSTETDHFSDPLVTAAFDYIKMNIRLPINVGDVVRYVKKSRKNLEVRFKTITGETLHDAIIRLKLKQVKRFLLESQLPLEQISACCGFNNDSYMGYVFKKENGLSPDQWRKKHRPSL